MTQTFSIRSEEELDEVCHLLEELLKHVRLITLKGEMGSGKTTLVKRFMSHHDFHEVSSPTFSIVNRYDSQDRTYYHFDLYRIEHENELMDIGFEEYLDSGNVCFIEWPEKASALIPEECIEVSIEGTGMERNIKVSYPQA